MTGEGRVPDGTAYRLDNLERRLDGVELELRDNNKSVRDRLHHQTAELQALQLICNTIPSLDRRIRDVEEANFAVLATKLAYVEQRVDTLAKGWWALTGSIVLASVTFALAVASGQI